ncbi:hypothetical protein LXL04_011013 [Taraxacum kok-saghyz]
MLMVHQCCYLNYSKLSPLTRRKTSFVYQLMLILIHSAFFIKEQISTIKGNGEEGKEGYLLTPASRLLLKDEPLSLSPVLLFMLDPLLMDPWKHMSEWFQNNDVTPFHTTHGNSIWDVASQEPKLNQFINESMASDTRLVASIITKHCASAFQGLNSFVDVGGGTGTISKAISATFPNVTCISFDLPHVVNGLEGSTNVRYVCGDMLLNFDNQ